MSDTLPDSANSLDLLDGLIRKARAAGAEACDALLVESVSLSHAQRLGALERLEREESRELGLRVLIGRRQAIASTTDTAPAALAALVERAVAMARAVPEDLYCGLAEPAELATTIPEIDSLDTEEPAPAVLIERARACEEAARAVPGISNSEGAEAGWSRDTIAVAASNGFTGTYGISRHGLAVSVIAGEALEMERDYEFARSVHGADLEDAETVGRRAGERTVKRLGARKPETGRVPVVYDPRVAGSLLRHLSGAINGTAIARDTSFLKDRLGEAVFGPGITVIDDPHRPRGLRSKPFDDEGIGNTRRKVVENGRLTTWVLDLRSARQLGLESTGHADRDADALPSPSVTNFYLEPGALSPKALIGDVEQGFYVLETMGMGVSNVTGDYSLGAAGFWIDKGEIAYPVSEVTIAGNLKDMFKELTPADDLVFRYGIDSPTLRVEGMTVAGA